MTERPCVRLADVRKRFGATVAVDGVDLEIRAGEFLALLGPSGCGKTTLLRLLAGFEIPDAGRIEIDGRDMTDVPPHRRPVNMMFQSYALFPHMTVAENVAFGLRQDRLPRSEIAERVAEMLALVQMGDLGRRRPDQLSGGQQQRVALARALAKRPKLLLLDEPLAALDKSLREQTQFELMAIQARTGVTFVVVTHDQPEAMTLATRLAVMDRGRIVQIGAPRAVYERPGSRYVAGFIGDVNLFEGRLAEPDRLELEGGDALWLDAAQTRGRAAGAALAVAVRPEKIDIASMPPVDSVSNRIEGRIAEIGYRGGLSVYRIRAGDGRLLIATVANRARETDDALAVGDRVWLSWPPAAGVVLDA